MESTPDLVADTLDAVIDWIIPTHHPSFPGYLTQTENNFAQAMDYTRADIENQLKNLRERLKDNGKKVEGHPKTTICTQPNQGKIDEELGDNKEKVDDELSTQTVSKSARKRRKLAPKTQEVLFNETFTDECGTCEVLND